MPVLILQALKDEQNSETISYVVWPPDKTRPLKVFEYSKIGNLVSASRHWVTVGNPYFTTLFVTFTKQWKIQVKIAHGWSYGKFSSGRFHKQSGVFKNPHWNKFNTSGFGLGVTGMTVKKHFQHKSIRQLLLSQANATFGLHAFCKRSAFFYSVSVWLNPSRPVHFKSCIKIKFT